MKKIGLLFNGVWSHYTFATAPKYVEIIQLVYIHDFNENLLAGLDGLLIPFQSNQNAISEKKELIYGFLAKGKKVFVEGDSSSKWLEAKWEDRPVNNYWWVENPTKPPISETDFTHPVYKGLSARHACWHTHGVYTSIPNNAQVIQKQPNGEIITWQTTQYGGILLATTLDPIVEHGVQQITHLDNYTDNLIEWMCGIRPEGKFEIPKENYGITI